MTNTTQRKALHVLYNLARNDEQADLAHLAERLSVSCVEADRALAALEQAGLVDAERVRLTLAGLVIAVSSDARKVPRSPEQAESRSASRAA
jgi:Mn-dependent DtxR family transcriptional regulator